MGAYHERGNSLFNCGRDHLREHDIGLEVGPVPMRHGRGISSCEHEDKEERGYLHGSRHRVPDGSWCSLPAESGASVASEALFAPGPPISLLSFFRATPAFLPLFSLLIPTSLRGPAPSP